MESKNTLPNQPDFQLRLLAWVLGVSLAGVILIGIAVYQWEEGRLEQLRAVISLLNESMGDQEHAKQDSIKNVLNQHADSLLKIPGVTLISIADNEEGECISIHLEREVFLEAIKLKPLELGGYPICIKKGSQTIVNK